MEELLEKIETLIDDIERDFFKRYIEYLFR